MELHDFNIDVLNVWTEEKKKESSENVILVTNLK